MAANPAVIIGTRAEARIVLDILNNNDVITFGFVTDDNEKLNTVINDVSVFGKIEDSDVKKILKDVNIDYFIAEGEIPIRRKLTGKLGQLCGRPPVNVIHRFAYVSPYAKIGFGNLLNMGAFLNPNTIIGDMNFFHSYVSVEPDVEIGNYCNFGSGVRIGGNVFIGNEVFIGTGAVIHPGVKIGEGAIIGAGAVVLRQVDPGTTVFGNPGQTIKK